MSNLLPLFKWNSRCATCIKIVELPYEQRHYLVVHDRESISQIVDCDKLIWKQVTF